MSLDKETIENLRKQLDEDEIKDCIAVVELDGYTIYTDREELEKKLDRLENEVERR